MVLPVVETIESTRQMRITEVSVTGPNALAEVIFDLKHSNGKIQRCFAIIPVNRTQQRYLESLPLNVWGNHTVKLGAEIDFRGQAEICITRIALNDMWLNPRPTTIDHFQVG